MSGVCVNSQLYLLPLAMAATISAGCEGATAPSAIAPTDLVVGLYTLTVNLESECPGIPELARNRSYTARIESKDDTSYVITLGDAKFVADETLPGGGAIIYCGGPLGCNQFVASREGDVLRFQLIPTPLDPDGEFFTAGGTIAELIPPASRLNISGTGVGALEGARIEASLTGDVSYSPSVSTPHNYVYCVGSSLRLTFTRR